jgi:hypothetical protein
VARGELALGGYLLLVALRVEEQMHFARYGRQWLAPRITISETIFAGLMFAMGVVTLVAILTSTPDDRLDIYFLGVLAGGLLWGVLGAFTMPPAFSGGASPSAPLYRR